MPEYRHFIGSDTVQSNARHGLNSNCFYYFLHNFANYVLTSKISWTRIYEYVYIRTSVSGFNVTIKIIISN